MSSPTPGASPAPLPPTSPPAPPTNNTAPPPAASAPSPPAATPPPVSTPPPTATSPPPTSSPPPPSAPPPVSTPPPSSTPLPPSPPTASPSPPSPPSSIPSPPSPPSSTPSPPSPPSSTPSPPSGTSPSPPSGGNPPPASGRSPPPPRGGLSPPSSTTPTSSSNGGSGGSGLSTGAIAGIVGAVLVVLIFIVLSLKCFSKKKRRNHVPPPSGPKVDPYGGPVYQWQHNAAPPPGDHLVSIPPKVSPPPAVASKPPYYPVRVPASQPSSGGSGSNYSGSENPLPPLSPGIAFGMSKSTFTYEELAMATDGFSDANLLGQGGFGYVHRGVLPNGKEIAVKQLKAGSGQGEREFQAEVDTISRVHHKHLVSLVGYCITGARRLLVYEFVPNNTLEFHLHGEGRPPIDFPTRLRIAVGSAKGLAYLHEDCHPTIIHRDVKAANILIDFNFEAKVADFGLAKFTSDANTHVSTRVMGTFGYLAPEYAASGKLSDKSDVFSFGVVLLELITGLRAFDSARMEDGLVEWARPLLRAAADQKYFDDLVDPRLENRYDSDRMARLVECAAACVRHSARRRPRLSQVVRVLEGSVSLDDLHEGIKPGESSVYSSHGSTDYDAAAYNQDRQQYWKMIASGNFRNSGYSEATSEYGKNPSASSSEAQTREMEMRKMKDSGGGFSTGSSL